MSFKVLILCGVSLPVLANFYDNHAEGWFWYHDPVIQEEEEASKEVLQKKSKEKPKTALDHLNAYKQNLELKKAQALMNPTDDTVQAYMMAQKEMSDKANYFSQVWQKVVLTNPDLNPEIKNPTAQFLRHIKNDEKALTKKQVLSGLSQSYGLFLFVRDHCPYCKVFAPVVKAFSDRYGFSVMVVYTGNQVDPEISALFEDIQANNGMTQAFGIESAPALMAFDAASQDLIPVSYGATSLDVLEQNLMILAGKR
ncbi:MAG: conjugal transfer protein TraF [Alphaproteobacteria bacterium]|nr:conjugal transfer protein TraF [Alphaproteobacteria bacterium]